MDSNGICRSLLSVKGEKKYADEESSPSTVDCFLCEDSQAGRFSLWENDQQPLMG